MLFWGLATHDWNCKSDRELDIIDGRSSWHDIGLFSLNQIFNLFHCLWAINQNLSQWKMMRESVSVIRDNNVKSTLRAINLPNFKNFHVVSEDITGHLEWSYIDYLNIWVLKTKNSAELRIFPLQEFFHRNSLKLLDRHRIDVYLNPSPSFDWRPFIFELIHHFLPHKQTLIGQFFNSILCLLLK